MSAVQTVIVLTSEVSSILKQARKASALTKGTIKFRKGDKGDDIVDPETGASKSTTWIQVEAPSDFDCGIGVGILLMLAFGAFLGEET